MNTANKEIIITNDSLILDIQNAFNFYYPFLKIEFGKKEKHFLPFKNHAIHPNSIVGQIAPVVTPAKVNVDNERTIAEIEKAFKDLMGVSIQVCRKSGTVWNIISLTDSWTLDSQNKAAEFISIEMAAAS